LVRCRVIVDEHLTECLHIIAGTILLCEIAYSNFRQIDLNGIG
jgi:hypothetical protein